MDKDFEGKQPHPSIPLYLGDGVRIRARMQLGVP
jgi:hypothetical protein